MIAVTPVVADLPLRWEIRLLIAVIGIALVLLATGIGMWRRRRTPDSPHLGIDPAMAASPTGAEVRGGNHDFLVRAKRAFMDAHVAFTHDPSHDVMRYMAPGVFHAWRQAQRPLSTAGTPSVSVKTMRLTHTARNAGGEVGVVEFHGILDLGDGHRHRLDEEWTFQRAGSAAPAGRHRLDRKECPACTKTLRLDREGRCGECHAVVATGEYDWAVTDVSPAGKKRR